MHLLTGVHADLLSSSSLVPVAYPACASCIQVPRSPGG